jgi:hypothetical protein
MKVKVFQSNHNGKIEFTRAELEKLLNEVYTDGYNEGKTSHWTWTSPYVGNLNDIPLLMRQILLLITPQIKRPH